MDPLRALLTLAGKRGDKVLAVFAASPADAARAVRYLRAEVPDVPVWLFSLAPPDDATAAMCGRVVVRGNAFALLLAAERALWPRWVALSVAAWTGGRLRWPVKLAPFLVPPFRALILNRNGDFLPGTPRNIGVHVTRLVRDTLHSGWHRARDVARGAGLWFFAIVAARFSPLSRRVFQRNHGTQALTIAVRDSSGEGIETIRYGHRHWDFAAVDARVRTSTCRWLMFMEGSPPLPDGWPGALLEDPRTFAVARQFAWRDWKPVVFPTAPFRQLQPGEAAQTLAPLSDVILVDRAKLAALGLPRTIVPGTAWMLLFWKAAAAGWRSYSIGAERILEEFPDWPYEDAEFVTRVLSDPALRALGPREPELNRGAIAFHPGLNRRQPPSDRLRVLVVSPYLPYPLSHGGAVRIWNLCRALGSRVDFTLACIREKNDHIAYEKLHEVFREVYVIDRDERAIRDALLPAQVREHQSASLRALIADLCRDGRIDLLQVEFTHMAQFRDAAPEVPAILVEHDLTFTLYRQFANQKVEYEKWLAFERGQFQNYDAVWTMSEQDRTQAVEVGAAGERTFVVPNGVDIVRFTPVHQPSDVPEVLYIGSFRHRPNIIGYERLVRDIMPAVWTQYPQAKLRVVAGPEPEKYWTPQGKLDQRIVMHAFVEDVRPLYASASVVAVPLLVSAGTNIKVMEAMACGKAVVSTAVGCQGLGLTDGRELLMRDDARAFADAVCALIADGVLAERIARNAREAVEQRFSWDAIADAAYTSYWALARRP